MKTLLSVVMLFTTFMLASPVEAQLPAPVYPPIATNPVNTTPFPGAGWDAWCWQVSPPLQCILQPTAIYSDSPTPNGNVKWNGYVSFSMSDGASTPANYTGFFIVWFDDPIANWIETSLPSPFDPLFNKLLVPTGIPYNTIPCTHTWANAFTHKNYAGFRLPPWSHLYLPTSVYGQSLSIDNSGVFRLGGAVRSQMTP